MQDRREISRDSNRLEAPNRRLKPVTAVPSTFPRSDPAQVFARFQLHPFDQYFPERRSFNAPTLAFAGRSAKSFPSSSMN